MSSHLKAHKLVEHVFRTFLVWGSFVLLFCASRLVFLFNRRELLDAEPYTTLDVLKALLLGLRFDFSLSTLVILPLFLIPLPKLLKKTYLVLTSVLLWCLLVTDHYFFDYYRDHFNTFFWEFWDNASNAVLVYDSVMMEFPVKSIFVLTCFGILLFPWLSLKALSYESRAPFSRFHSFPKTTAVLAFLLLALLARSTFSVRPLPIQDRRESISSHSFINAVHRNPLFPLYESYKTKSEWSEDNSYKLSRTETSALFQSFANEEKGAKWRFDETKELYSIERIIQPRMGQVLKRKPKHIVLFFLESYSYWVMHHPNTAFAQQMSRTLLALKEDGVYFNQHFSSDVGTLKNIASVNFGFPVPKSFHPALNYHKESFKNFPTRLSSLLKNEGYQNYFYYGSFAKWHNLHEFVPRMGYDEFYAQHNFPEYKQHDYGLFDGDLFDALHQHLKSRDESSFSFIMSQSNHPPYRLPDDFDDSDLWIPKEVSALRTVDPENFRWRMRCFRYADRALGEYFAKAATENYFDDTLYIITGDHPFGGVKEKAEDLHTMSKIPLVFYAPNLMRDEWKGKQFEQSSSHLDIPVTLLSLIGSSEKTITTWGVDLLEGIERPFAINAYLDCAGDYCLANGAVLKRNGPKLQRGVPADLQAEYKRNIEEASSRFGNMGLQYLHKF